MICIGIDVGTSGVKAVLLEDGARLLGEASRPIAVSRPHVGWSEQDADLWVEAAFACLDRLAAERPAETAAAAAIGLSGQMLAALLLDEAHRPLRPAILWNDQRALAECAELLARVPDIGRRTNGAPDPGLTAPKLLWLARREPRTLERARLLLLTKDYLRLALTGEAASEPTDAGGTQLLDVGRGAWDAGLCAAAGWDPARLPPLTRAWSAAGGLRPALAARWGMRAGLPIAAGAGDNMATALGVGAARPGEAVLSIGTSGVSCVVSADFRPIPQKAVLTCAHAAPDAFLSMGVVMSATASLDWTAALGGVGAATLAAEAEGFAATGRLAEAPSFLPCLTGVRTPLNRPDALGRIDGLHPGVDRAMLGYATMEGVAFQFADCVAAQTGAGVGANRFAAVGGGARSRLWVRLLATLLGAPVTLPALAPVSAPAGAARLAAAAAGAGLAAPWVEGDAVAPDPALAVALADRRARFDALAPAPG